jgi:hypothetical protein
VSPLELCGAVVLGNHMHLLAVVHESYGLAGRPLCSRPGPWREARRILAPAFRGMGRTEPRAELRDLRLCHPRRESISRPSSTPSSRSTGRRRKRCATTRCSPSPGASRWGATHRPWHSSVSRHRRGPGAAVVPGT